MTKSSPRTRFTYDFFHEVIEVFTIDVLPCTFKFLDSAGGGHCEVKRDPNKSTVKIKVYTEYLRYLLNRRRTRRVK